MNAKLRTSAIGLNETLLILQDSLQRLTAARELLESGKSLAALRTLTWIRELNARAISAGLSTCLLSALEIAEKSDDANERERLLQELIRLTGFELSALCVTCRRKVKLKRG